jgi:hypothetical protein
MKNKTCPVRKSTKLVYKNSEPINGKNTKNKYYKLNFLMG